MAVRREIEAVTGREVAIGAVYATLDRLEAKRLVASERGRGRRRAAAVRRDRGRAQGPGPDAGRPRAAVERRRPRRLRPDLG